MSRGKRYTDEFKTEAVKHIVDRGYSVNGVAERLGICTKTLYQWRPDQYGSSQQIKSSDDQAEIARLKTELNRVTEERNILGGVGDINLSYTHEINNRPILEIYISTIVAKISPTNIQLKAGN